MPDLVSIVIPCYKGSRFLANTIDSCLKQTYRNVEVIVVDDASPQNDAEIAAACAARDSRVRVLRREANGGVSRAYNSGYAVAGGEYFTRLSQDDLFREDAIEIMLRTIQAAPPDVGLVYCDMQKVDENGRWLSRWNQAEDPYVPGCSFESEQRQEQALFPTQEVGLCVMWRRCVHLAMSPPARSAKRASEAIGPFRPRYDFAEDYDFYLRVSRKYLLAKCGDEAPFFFRCHPSQNGTVSQMQQSAAYSLAQMSHAWATVKRRPTRWRCWKGIVGCGLRVGVLRAKICWRSVRARG
jgi:glycosyltransferase involved in cell wall biosynthesis